MSNVILELLAFALIIIIAGLLLIVSLVRELEPEQRRNWLLGIGLGTGVITFSLKIAFIVVFGLYSEPMLALLPALDFKHHSSSKVEEIYLPSDTIQTSYRWQALPSVAPFPEDNPPTREKIELGKKLFFDERLSADNSLSCASCHEISNQKGGADGQRVSNGINAQQGERNAPTVLNAAFQRVLFWDGRATSLEEQAKGPLVNSVEMGMPNLQSVVDKLRNIAQYQTDFEQAFASKPAITIDNIVKAIATFERTLITAQSPYDRFVKGDATALSKQQQRGMMLFESTGCIFCHSGPNFSDASVFSDNSPYRIFPANPIASYEKNYQFGADPGIKVEPTTKSVKGIWRIPSLRNISRTGPYFHNGSVDSLNEAVRIMARVELNRTLSNNPDDDNAVLWSNSKNSFNITRNQALSDAEVDDIVAFLESLNGDIADKLYHSNPGPVQTHQGDT